MLSRKGSSMRCLDSIQQIQIANSSWLSSPFTVLIPQPPFPLFKIKGERETEWLRPAQANRYHGHLWKTSSLTPVFHTQQQSCPNSIRAIPPTFCNLLKHSGHLSFCYGKKQKESKSNLPSQNSRSIPPFQHRGIRNEKNMLDKWELSSR